MAYCLHKLPNASKLSTSPDSVVPAIPTKAMINFFWSFKSEIKFLRLPISEDENGITAFVPKPINFAAF